MAAIAFEWRRATGDAVPVLAASYRDAALRLGPQAYHAVQVCV